MPPKSNGPAEVKRLRQIIERAAIAIKDTDLHMMLIDARSLQRDDRNALDDAISGIRVAREILAEAAR